MMRVSTLPADRCFVTTLAQGLWERAGGDPLRLSSYVVYLPTRRACRHLREAFLRVTGAKAALLPRMKPLGDVDEDDLDFAGAPMMDGLLPAISPLRRQMTLMRLLMHKDESLPMDQAAALAQALGKLLDQVQSEGLDLKDIEKLSISHPSLSAYWQETLTFLEIVMKVWPDYLREEGCLDPAVRRDLVLHAQAEAWRDKPPAHPVIAAGSTGSVPAVGRLMGVIASLPEGEVILPGLDLTLPDGVWDMIDETHPQATMKSWLDEMGIARQNIGFWSDLKAESYAPSPRLRLLQEMMRPADATSDWRFLEPDLMACDALSGFELIELDHQREEADVIALRLRAVLEEEGKTAALVTPDRELAACVASALRRWGIEVNDSAGTPLAACEVGRFLIEVLRAAEPAASPLAYLSLLKHPLCGAGKTLPQCREAARQIEQKAWRGVRRCEGWDGAARALHETDPKLSLWLEEIALAFSPLQKDWSARRPIADWVQRHVALAEWLARSASDAGEDRLWRKEAGETAAMWFDEWVDASRSLPAITGSDYAALFEALVRQVVVRERYGQHPRLSILGPLEARLIHHDLIILGGLNETVWPPAPVIDPWLSRPMKKEFGLPSPERRIGQSAHDFVQMCGARNVLMTRASRVGGSPTVPSRFLLRLKTVLQAATRTTEVESLLYPQTPWAGWASALDAWQGPLKTMKPPAPRPKLADRPKEVSVTEVGKWMRNPYEIYAKKILKLRKLEDIDADPSIADYGNVAHAAFESFIRKTKDAWPSEPLPLLIEEGRSAFAAFAQQPQVFAFWWPQFLIVAEWFVQTETKRRAEGYRPLDVEANGAIGLACAAARLRGRVDRIDLRPDGSLEIIDYKTGEVPSKTHQRAGYEPQLALIGLIAQAGGFETIGKREVGSLAYWETKRESLQHVFTEDCQARIDKAKEGLERLLMTYQDESVPFEAEPKPSTSPKYNDYAHLSRIAEWGRSKDGDA